MYIKTKNDSITKNDQRRMALSVSIRDLLELPSFKGASVVAGESGLDNTIVSISVIETGDEDSLGIQFEGKSKNYKQEVVITAFAEVRNSVDKQCSMLKKMYYEGEIALVLYYVGYILPSIDDRLIELANELGMPLIVMPSNLELRYADALNEVLNLIIIDRQKHKNFSSEIIERLSKIDSMHRSIDMVFSLLRDRTKISIFLLHEIGGVLNAAEWPIGRNINLEYVLVKFENGEIRESEITEVTVDDDIFFVSIETIKISNSQLKLVLAKEGEQVTYEECNQIRYVVSTYLNLWTDDYGRIDSKQLVSAIINNEPEKMRRIAKAMKFNVKALSCNYYFYLENNMENNYARLFKATSIVKEFFSSYKDNFLAESFDDTVVAMTSSDEKIESDETFLYLLDELKENNIQCRLISCCELKSTKMAKASFWLYKKNIENLLHIYPEKRIYNTSDLMFARDIRKEMENVESDLFKSDLEEKIYKTDGELVDTISTYMLDTDMSIQETANKLFVHNNTIKYRKRQMEKILGYKINKLPESIEIYKTLAKFRISKNI